MTNGFLTALFGGMEKMYRNLTCITLSNVRSFMALERISFIDTMLGEAGYNCGV